MRRTLTAFAKLIGFFAALFLVAVLAAVPVRLVFGPSEQVGPRLEILVIGVMFVVGVAVVSAVMARFGGPRMAMSGWPGRRVLARWFGVGALVGLGLAGAMLVLVWASGGARPGSAGGGPAQYLGYVVPLLGALLLAALGEEWIFRGYPLAVLGPVVGRLWANVAVSLVFTAAHWGGNGWGALAAANIFLFSMVNGAIRFTPGGIPAAWGLHFSWNALQVLVGATLTGGGFAVPMVRFVARGPGWLSGGAYGPEGAIGATVATIAGLVLLRRMSSPLRNPLPPGGPTGGDSDRAAG